ncbi:HdeA/HdeB family chaperone [Providencia stuartii]|uniref:HdeA/HdeB family chaperone n=1 Tax=Providencia stuartii TaxID=588 RepID=UPI001E51EB95|nr:HdeA/HdeB family chaperone [Providencia stuartii]MCX3072183.1 HdeA/HdeB family chaperone [Providencia stuartii]
MPVFLLSFNPALKVEDPTLNISGIETVTPLIVDACKKAPKESFIQKVEEYLKKW